MHVATDSRAGPRDDRPICFSCFGPGDWARCLDNYAWHPAAGLEPPSALHEGAWHVGAASGQAATGLLRGLTTGDRAVAHGLDALVLIDPAPDALSSTRHLLDLPTLLIGTDPDGRLRGSLAPHFRRQRWVPQADGAPFDMLLRAVLTMPRPVDAAIDPGFRSLMDGDHISARTRSILLDRARGHAAQATVSLNPPMLAVLRAVLDRVLPQADVLPHGGIDLGRLIDERLSTPGDGWRFAELPPDADAYAAALRTLDRAARERAALPFILLDRAGQDDLLRRADAGTLTVTPAEGDATLSAAQMRLWCLDLRADAAQAFVSHPAVMARLGIDSALNGGDAPMQGFEELRAGHHAPWEPPAPAALPGHVA